MRNLGLTSPQGKITTMYVTYYLYNDIIIINIDKNGQIEWTQKIPKIQRTSEDFGFFSSYFLAVSGDKLYFIFNDDPRNIYYKGDGVIKPFTKQADSQAVLVEMDKDGNYTREALFSTKEAKVLIRPVVCEQISDNEIILFGQKGTMQRFIKGKFKDN
jgi:hypothetical protein